MDTKDTKYVALQEGREGLLGSGTCQWGLFWKSQALVGVEGFFVVDCLDLCVWASDLPALLGGGGVSMSSAKDTFVFLRKKNKVFMDLGVKIASLTGLTLVKGWMWHLAQG